MKEIAVVELSKGTIPKKLIELRNLLKENGFNGKYGIKDGQLSLSFEKIQFRFSISEYCIEIFADGEDYELVPILIDLQEYFESVHSACIFSSEYLENDEDFPEDDNDYYFRSLIQGFKKKPIISFQRYHRRKLRKKCWTAYKIKLTRIESLYEQEYNNEEQKELRIYPFKYDCEDMDQTLDIPRGTVYQVLLAYVSGKVYDDLPGIIYWAIVEIYCNSTYFFGSVVGKAKFDIPITAFNELSSFRQCYLGEIIHFPSTEGNPPVFSIMNAELDKALDELESTNFSESVVSQFQNWITEAKEGGDDLLIYYY